MAGYHCPACEHPVPPAAWAEASSVTEAVLGCNVQSEWIEMRHCPSCQLLLRRASGEQWHAAPAHLIAALEGVRECREQWAADGAYPAAEYAPVGQAARQVRDEARARRAETRRAQEPGRDVPARQASRRARLAART